MATVVAAFLLMLVQGASAATLALYNRCPETVWPGIQPSAGKEVLARGGMRLPANRATSAHRVVGARVGPTGLQVRRCGAGRGRCATAGPSAQDFYDVSLVDGYNVAIAMAPYHGKGGAGCVAAGCVSDLNRVCPAGLAVVGCSNACAAYGAPQHCCTGRFGGPQQCKPTAYSRLFKSACPRAYDDPTSILTCSAGTSYVVTFCPHHR